MAHNQLHLNYQKIPVKERRYVLCNEDWLIPPNTEIKVTYKVISKHSETSLRRSSEIYDLLRPTWPDIDYYESFIVTYLNKCNKVIGSQLLSTGGITGTIVDPRMIIQTALLLGAVSLVLSHNHPSGNIQPSAADKEITNTVKTAAKYFDIKVSDHLIITNEKYFSFADEGLL